MASHSIVLAPANHPSTEREIESLQKELFPQAKDKIRRVTLEAFADSLIEACDGEYKQIFERFKKRYLNFKEN